MSPWRNLQDRAPLLDAVLAQLQERILVVDADGNIAYCNTAIAEMLGLTLEQLLGLNIGAIAATPQNRVIIENIRRALAGERVSNILNVDDHRLSCVYMPIRHEPTGKSGALLIVFDVTEAQNAAEALEVSEGRFNALVQGAMDAIVSVNVDGNIVQVNPACMQLFGYAKAEMIGQSLDLLLPPNERTRHRALLDGFARSHDSSRGMANFREVQGITKNGETLFLEVAISKYGGPKSQIMTAIIRDVTHRHQMESQLRHFDKMRAIGQLAGGIAHDFNNVIAVIQGATELSLEAAGEDARMERYLRRILAAAHLSKDLTSKLLLFARDEPPQRQEVMIAAFFGDLREMLERIFPANVVIDARVDSDCWSVTTDRSQLQNALINLAINARDAMPNGGRVIFSARNRPVLRYIDMNQATQQADMVEIAVTDTGTGMTEEVRNRAMEPFFTTKPRGEGNGLGLATVYGIVRRADGVIALDSAPGEGTTVTILLPRYKASKETAQAAKPQPVSRSQHTILFVEDNAALRETLAEQLRNGGMIVHTASSIQEAQQAFAKVGRVDLLLTDFRLAAGTGLDLALMLRSAQPHLPVLIMTGYLEIASTTKLPEGIAFLIKPVPFEELLDHIERATAG